MSQTLYRKYRPQRFSDVTEQAHVVTTLMNQLRADTIAHAYLFSGPRGVGKTTVARLLAKAVNCETRGQGDAEPCNACGACREFDEGRFVDTIEMDAASHTGVDNVRESVIETTRFVPQRGTYKVFIIDEVHMLSTSAFNALLKTLEEPPPHVLFILATTETHKIPATILSRCQRFDFHRITKEQMVARLKGIALEEGREVDDDVLMSIARLSEGCLRDAESLLGQVLAAGEGQVTREVAEMMLPLTNRAAVLAVVDAVTAGDLPRVFACLRDVVAGGGSMRHFLDECIDMTRSILFTALGAKTDEPSHDVAAYASRVTAPEAERLLDCLLTARNRPSPSLIPQLSLELALAEWSLARHAPDSPQETPPSKARSSFVEATAPKVTFTLEALQNKWERCCAHVAERSASLPLLLRSGKPMLLEGHVVTVGFSFPFHAEALSEAKNRQLVEEAILAVMMERVIVRAVATNAEATNDPVTMILAELGGSVA